MPRVGHGRGGSCDGGLKVRVRPESIAGVAHPPREVLPAPVEHARSQHTGFATTFAVHKEVSMPGKKYDSIKKPETYEALREKGMSKERAAKISNAQARDERKGKGK